MNTLTENELKMYLGTKLKVKIRENFVFNDKEIGTLVGLDQYEVHLNDILQTISEGFYYADIKPILYPLSMLTQPIWHEGKEVNVMVELLKLKYPKWYEEHKDDRYGKIDFDENSAWFSVHAPHSIKVKYNASDLFTYPDYCIILELVKYHFDFQNLIGQNKAISVTNEFNPYK